MPETVFKFKQFEVKQDKSAMKIGTDSVLLGSWVKTDGINDILDIGTGSGVLALMLAQKSVDANVHAVEIDTAACEQAEENFKNSSWSERLRSFNMSIQDFAYATEQKYDLIVCNPPFFTGGTLSDNLDRSMVRHTIKLPHGDLLIAVRKLLRKNGRFCVVLPYLEGIRFKEMAQSSGLFCNKILGIKPGFTKEVERLLIDFSFQPADYQYKEITLRKEDTSWTDDYKNLTKDFYLNT